MRINAVTGYQSFPIKNLQKTNKVSTDDESVKTSNVIQISFRGNPLKHPEQILAFATESNYLGGIYCAGGLGDVAAVLPESIGKYGKDVTGKDIDMRTALPYYTFDDPEGRIYVLRAESAEKAKKGMELTRKDDFILVNQDYKLKDGEQFALITESKNGNKVDKYFLLKDLNLQGDVERISDTKFEMEKVPYRMFEVVSGDKADKHYIIHTPEHAKGKFCYGVFTTHRKEAPNGSTGYGGGSSTAYGKSSSNLTRNGKYMHYHNSKTDDMFYTEQLRVLKDVVLEGKMDSEAYGNYNPQNVIMHDRFGYALLSDVTQDAKNGNKNMQGFRFVGIFHNIGPDKQGRYDNPLDFFRIVATKSDLEKLKANPNYATVEKISERINAGKATAKESTQLYNFFLPYFSKLTDSDGLFNMTKIAIAMTDENPQNMNIGNVSRYFGKETRNFDTEEIAQGLTQALIDVESKTIDVVNGAKKANMETDKMGAFFGTGILSEVFKTKYSPYSITDNIDKIFKAKKENKKNLINIVAEATEKLNSDSDAVAKVFFNENMMNGIRTQAGEPTLKLTLGGLSPYQEGDILFTTWGRPDAQKGLPATLRSFRHMLTDESIPLETRKHCKLIMGAGGKHDAFSGNNTEWKYIQEEIKKIAEIEINGEKGIFKNNACYVNGTFPKRIANCVDLTIFTSRYEPCGITPFESYAAGTPTISIKTGGAPDFIFPGKTGFLTQDPYKLSYAKLGLAKDVPYEKLDDARMEHISKQVAEQIKAYLEPLKDGTFEAKQKEYIKNCLAEKIEWHNNNAYNCGRSALDIYLNTKMNIKDNNLPNEYVSDFRGEFDNTAFKSSKGKFKGKALLIAGGIAAVLGLGYTGYKKGWFTSSTKTTSEDASKKGSDDHISCVA